MLVTHQGSKAKSKTVNKRFSVAFNRQRMCILQTCLLKKKVPQTQGTSYLVTSSITMFCLIILFFCHSINRKRICRQKQTIFSVSLQRFIVNLTTSRSYIGLSTLFNLQQINLYTDSSQSLLISIWTLSFPSIEGQL